MAPSRAPHGPHAGFDVDTLYALLPAVYRTRDAEAGEGNEPLRALLAVIAEQVAGLEENIEQLYDDQFIETCADWVVPYIADLIGYRPFDPRLQESLGSNRADVADTIRLRRRKGTAAVLEELAFAVTGWDAAVVEFFQRLAVTQYLNHVRIDPPGPAPERVLDQPGTVDVRRADRLERMGTPFDPAAHTADVRVIGGRRGPTSARGYWNIPAVGIYLWRVGSRRLTDSPAFRVDGRRFLFNPLGANTQLFCAAGRDDDAATLAGPLDVPLPITRRLLRSHLRDLYGPGRTLTVQRDGQVLDLDEVESCDLSDTGPVPETSAWAHAAHDRVAIDPVLGRISFPDDVGGADVRVTFHEPALSDIGGGEYDRQERLGPAPEPLRQVPGDRADLAQGLADLPGAGTVELSGSGRHDGPAGLSVASDSRLELRAASGSRPLLRLRGDLVVQGGDGGEVTLAGLLIEGGRLVVPATVGGVPNRLQSLRLVDCTLVPGRSLTRSGEPAGVGTSLEVEAPHVSVHVERSIVGAVRVAGESRISLSHAVLDGLGTERVAYAAPGAAGTDGTAAGGELALESCTVIGKVNAGLLTASNSILHARLGASDPWVAPVMASRRQAGYVRFSYVPLDAQVPPRHACVPRASEVGLLPRFESLRYHSAAYVQLHASCPCEIRTGAEDGGELGAYHDRYVPQRQAGLWTRLDEYLRFGLEAGVLFAS
ncbi:phage tail protein [Microbacterium ureisolvens]|uniref:phage tail protein n=1 Tax=Microbacterium ureisolvens TaxID=2781186 RepID=UPI00362F8C17